MGLKLILAGGLRQDNVSDAIQRLNLWGVDVASGGRGEAGQKEPRKTGHLYPSSSRRECKRPLTYLRSLLLPRKTPLRKGFHYSKSSLTAGGGV